MTDESQNPFVVKLWWSFHNKQNLFLVMDFHPGGDLGTQLARWGRLGRDRARFYAAEIVEGVEGLHAAGVVYRNLKPKNVLIGFDRHIVLTDFGLSKQFPLPYPNLSGSSTAMDRAVLPRWMAPDQSPNSGRSEDLSNKDFTDTFCGTPEYLAPEVIQGLQYSYEVDWWAFGTMLYEMLSGVTPFWADNHPDMYVRVLQDELQFPGDKAFDQDTKSLIRGLLQRSPTLRIREPRLKRHPYFSMIDWSHVYYKRYIPPYIPPIDSSNASDTQNFDDAFLDMSPTLSDGPEPDFERESSEDGPLDSD
ncbi:kinase-like domain-containing protein, partial [Cantharellus anzutake]|uniref:kinase-like domain-containing protein n=1 Tax=Cantharellus anzutake TaxID=1750568 RepID=UPI001907780E